MRQVRDGLEQNLTSDVNIEACRIKLVELEDSKISFEIVRVLAGLNFNVLLEMR